MISKSRWLIKLFIAIFISLMAAVAIGYFIPEKTYYRGTLVVPEELGYSYFTEHFNITIAITTFAFGALGLIFSLQELLLLRKASATTDSNLIKSIQETSTEIRVRVRGGLRNQPKRKALTYLILATLVLVLAFAIGNREFGYSNILSKLFSSADTEPENKTHNVYPLIFQNTISIDQTERRAKLYT